MLQAKLNTNKIVMSFSTPPGADDLKGLAEEMMEYLPGTLKRKLNDLEIVVEDFPDPDVEDELGLESPYDQMAYYKSMTIPGQMPTSAPVRAIDGDVLVLYRRAILDLWCETEQELADIVRTALIQEIGAYFNLPDHDIDEMLV